MSPSATSAPPRPRRRILWGNVVFLTVTPLAAAIAVPWYVVTRGVTWVELAACAGMWVLVGLGVTVGYHRLFTHRAWEAPAPVRAVFAVLGAAALQNSVITWAAAHRFHHRFVDSHDDPYNPQEGFWYSHMGWILVEGPHHDDVSNVPDLEKDPVCRWQHRYYLAIAVLANLGFTAVLAAVTGNLLGMVVFALLLRIVLTHHFTFLINSAAHMWGTRRWSVQHSARDNWALSLLTFGEGYHNYHHTFQADYRNGPAWYSWDPSKWLIWSLSRVGLAHDLRRSTPEVRLRRLYEQARRRLDERLTGLGSGLEEARHRAEAIGESGRASLQARVAAAEERFERALAELRALRRSADAALRHGADEARALRRRAAEAQRDARAALAEWEALTRAYLSQLSPAPRAAEAGQ